jgi:hypothetical protein
VKKKAIFALTILLFSGSLAVAQPSQEMPDRVFGTVEDTQGNTVTDTEVEVVFDGETLASDTTDEDGYYDITVPYGEDYSSEEVRIQISGSQVDTFTYSSGEVEEINLMVESSQQQNNQEEQTSSGSGGGGGAGAFPSQDEEQEDQDVPDNATLEKQNSSRNENGEDEEGTDSSEDAENSTEDTQDRGGSQEGSSLITGMFTSSVSSVGEMVSNFINGVVSSLLGIF